MSLLRLLVCVLLPPLAVVDKGCGSFILVTFMTLFGSAIFGFPWPGAIAAIIVNLLRPSPEVVVRNRYFNLEVNPDAETVAAPQMDDDGVIDIKAEVLDEGKTD